MADTERHDARARSSTQLLHFVFGGELTSLGAIEFADVTALDMVGIYPNYASAHRAWKAKAQSSVDNAHMRYFIVHMHRLLDPESDATAGHPVGHAASRAKAK
jgi:hypothetical protein